MFIGRRRPLLRAAMVGGAGYMVGKRRAQSQEAQQQQEQQQAPQAAPAPSAPAGGGSDLVGQLKQLTDMKASGALSDAEFEAAKAKLLGGS
jgi:Short C-terminal domain